MIDFFISSSYLVVWFLLDNLNNQWFLKKYSYESKS